MKKNSLFITIVSVLMIVSCTPLKYYGDTLITKDSRVIPYVTSIGIKHDTVYYQKVDTTLSTWNNIQVTTDTIYAIAANNILSGAPFLVEQQQDGSYVGEFYTPLDTLPLNMDTTGSVLTYRVLCIPITPKKETMHKYTYKWQNIITLKNGNSYIMLDKSELVFAGKIDIF